MVTRVLVVDDSGFFRRRIVEMLEADARIQVVGTAGNGREAVDQVARLKPDVVTMDIEMPVMDGITAVRHIMASHPTPVLMFSSLTREGASATLDALDAGAVDFLPKKFDEIAADREQVKMLLRRRIHAVARRQPVGARAVISETAAKPAAGVALANGPLLARARRVQFDVVAIASSTGGPVALTQVLTRLPANFRAPVVVVQHMPASFTPAFAQRLDQQCAVSVKEAAEGDQLRGGHVYIAPGGRQMTFSQQAGKLIIHIEDGRPEMHYKPCADVSFSSIAAVCGAKVLGLVLTGMGADGREGARVLKSQGATIWSQDEASSVIYGMPMAVAEAGLSDLVMPLCDIGPSLVQTAGG